MHIIFVDLFLIYIGTAQLHLHKSWAGLGALLLVIVIVDIILSKVTEQVGHAMGLDKTSGTREDALRTWATEREQDREHGQLVKTYQRQGMSLFDANQKAWQDRQDHDNDHSRD